MSLDDVCKNISHVDSTRACRYSGPIGTCHQEQQLQEVVP